MFIAEHRSEFPVALMCRLLEVSRNGFYAWIKSAAREINPEHAELLERVKEVAKASGYSYGSRRMKAALTALGYPISRNKARKLMQEAGVKARQKRKYKITTNSDHNLPVFENLLDRQFDVEMPDQVYASDFTYLWTGEGWLYLAVLLDLYSRKVVGWNMSARADAVMVCDALKMAISDRHPDRGLIHHSDRGTQYASKKFRKLLSVNGLVGSMSRKGDCWDNSVVESFFGSLKQERVHHAFYATREDARRDVLNYITMFYNSNKLHSYLGYVSPNNYEMKMQKAA